MKLFQFLVAALLFLFVGSALAVPPDPSLPNPPLQVREANVDSNDWIAVHEQGTAKVEVQGVVDVNVTGGTVTVDSIPNIVIESMPPMLNGDHPALTSFSQRTAFSVTATQVVDMYFNEAGNKVCNPGDKMIITIITGRIHGQRSDLTTFPLSVKIRQPVLYFLSDSAYRTDSFSTHRSMTWNEKTNIIIDADPEIIFRIWQGPAYGSNTWYGEWSIYGYCFTP